MNDRFKGLKKIPDAPAARSLAAASAKLKAKIKAPASANVPTVLAELEKDGAIIDMIRLMSTALPPRECVWWACIAAREVAGGEETPCIKAAEAWVFEPSEANRAKVQLALETADTDDDTTMVATAALYAPGNLGPGDDLKDIEAPPAALSACTFGMNMMSLRHVPDANDHLQIILDRALDIARGGNGSVKPAAATEDTAEHSA